jgi:hypothetical protein
MDQLLRTHGFSNAGGRHYKGFYFLTYLSSKINA